MADKGVPESLGRGEVVGDDFVHEGGCGSVLGGGCGCGAGDGKGGSSETPSRFDEDTLGGDVENVGSSFSDCWAILGRKLFPLLNKRIKAHPHGPNTHPTVPLQARNPCG